MEKVIAAARFRNHEACCLQSVRPHQNHFIICIYTNRIIQNNVRAYDTVYFDERKDGELSVRQEAEFIIF